MEFKGTKGEWKAVEFPKKQGYCTHEVQFGNDGECVTDGVYNEHDAKLIAAAPDLLEALQELIPICEENDFESYSTGKRLMEQARKAINKALASG